MEDQIVDLEKCHRCLCRSRERLTTHTTCHNCNYSYELDPIRNFVDDRDWQIPLWAYDALRGNYKTEPTEHFKPQLRYGA